MDYCYIAAPEDHYDLEDCFDGVYDKEKKAWRFNISQKEEVLNFLSPDGDEETPDGDVVDYLNKHTKAKPKRSRSIHRARSACTNKSSDSDSDPDSDEWINSGGSKKSATKRKRKRFSKNKYTNKKNLNTKKSNIKNKKTKGNKNKK